MRVRSILRRTCVLGIGVSLLLLVLLSWLPLFPPGPVARVAASSNADPEHPVHPDSIRPLSDSPGRGRGAGGDGASVERRQVGLPINESITSTGLAVVISQFGTGSGASFRIRNPNSGGTALDARTDGTGLALNATSTGTGTALNVRSTGARGRAGSFTIANPTNSNDAVNGWTSGIGSAGSFEINNPSGYGRALRAKTNGNGSAIYGENTGGRYSAAGDFFVNGDGDGIKVRTIGPGFSVYATHVWPAGTAVYVRQGDPYNWEPGLDVAHSGPGLAGYFYSQYGPGAAVASGSSTGLIAEAGATGNWAGEFRGIDRGVQIRTYSGTGLEVIGGTKSAVVRTDSGPRALYTEESSEVWFTDYGFGRLDNTGRARVAVDPTFAETVHLNVPYHVFVQAYGDAELYVGERTSSSFEVVLRDGDQTVEFSYRIVAKRKGFESRRLEAAAWPGADAKPPRWRPEPRRR